MEGSQTLENPKCQECGDSGIVYWQYDIIIGYISHEMAMDAGDLSYEGVPIYGKDWAHDFCECEIGKELRLSQ